MRSSHVRFALLVVSLVAGCGGATVVGELAVAPPDMRGPSSSGGGGGGGGGAATATNPNFGSTVQLDVAPPPLSGGTLLLLADASTAVAADPDRDLVYVVNLDQHVVHATITLSPAEEPGRLVEDAHGMVHVVLRRGGAVLDLNPIAGSILGRRPVCSMPRGIAYDAAGDRLWVACAGGELLAMPAGGGPPGVRHQIDGDLRDVVLAGGELLVSRFRAAEVLSVDAATGHVRARRTPPPIARPGVVVDAGFVAAVLWRMIAWRDGLLLVHQAANTAPLGSLGPPTPGGGYYGSPPRSTMSCDNRALRSALTQLQGGKALPTFLDSVALPVDVAADPIGTRIAVAVPAHASSSRPDVAVFEVARLGGGCALADTRLAIEGQAVAVAFRGNAELVIQSREPAMLVVVDMNEGIDGVVTGASRTSIALDTRSARDTGHDIFHLAAGSDVTCASCHVEGGEDGRTWKFKDVGARRTPSLRGGVMDRMPFHWKGELPNLELLLGDVYRLRMGGAVLKSDQRDALAHYMGAIPALPPPAVDPQVVARGKLLFDAVAGCVVCHSGPQLTSRLAADVGTGGVFKVPSLRGLAWRAPYLHDGSAATIADRLAIPGDRHGITSKLTPDELSDLGAYLESL